MYQIPNRNITVYLPRYSISKWYFNAGKGFFFFIETNVERGIANTDRNLLA